VCCSEIFRQSPEFGKSSRWKYRLTDYRSMHYASRVATDDVHGGSTSVVCGRMSTLYWSAVHLYSVRGRTDRLTDYRSMHYASRVGTTDPCITPRVLWRQSWAVECRRAWRDRQTDRLQIHASMTLLSVDSDGQVNFEVEVKYSQ